MILNHKQLISTWCGYPPAILIGGLAWVTGNFTANSNGDCIRMHDSLISVQGTHICKWLMKNKNYEKSLGKNHPASVISEGEWQQPGHEIDWGVWAEWREGVYAEARASEGADRRSLQVVRTGSLWGGNHQLLTDAQATAKTRQQGCKGMNPLIFQKEMNEE